MVGVEFACICISYGSTVDVKQGSDEGVIVLSPGKMLCQWSCCRQGRNCRGMVCAPISAKALLAGVCSIVVTCTKTSTSTSTLGYYCHHLYCSTVLRGASSGTTTVYSTANIRRAQFAHTTKSSYKTNPYIKFPSRGSRIALKGPKYSLRFFQPQRMNAERREDRKIENFAPRLQYLSAGTVHAQNNNSHRTRTSSTIPRANV